MHLIDYIILGLVAVLLGIAIYMKVRQGKSGNCCGCSECHRKEQCGRKEKE